MAATRRSSNKLGELYSSDEFGGHDDSGHDDSTVNTIVVTVIIIIIIIIVVDGTGDRARGILWTYSHQVWVVEYAEQRQGALQLRQPADGRRQRIACRQALPRRHTVSTPSMQNVG